MTDRLNVNQINSDQLDALYDLNEATLAAATASYDAARAAETERNGAYRERAHLVALLAAMAPGAVITPAPDVDEPGWQIAYLTIGGRQASWHISPRDTGLFAAVERVESDDPRAQWDGHTTEEKYAGIAAHTAELAEAGHVYLSTGCLHNDHAYCKAMTGLNGAKRPGECKKCGARCICPCHTDQPKEQPMPACTATIEGPHVPSDEPVQCTRQAGHAANHVGPPEKYGELLWNDTNAGAVPHGANSEEQR